MSNENDKISKEYLNQFLDNDNGNNNVPPVNNNTNTSYASDGDMSYLNVMLDILPCGMFYKPGTKIKIRAAKVSEVQAYSVVDDKNYLDITEKMNEMLSSCVKVVYANGLNGSYRDLKDGDRIFLIFMIRELTFQQGSSLAKDLVCDHCNHEFKAPFRATPGPNAPKTFKSYEMNEKLKPFFNAENRYFQFDVDGKIFKLAPPTIGLQEIFFKEIRSKVQSEKTPNVSFLKIIPYMLWDRNTITEEGIKAKEEEFKNLSMKEFQILNKAVDMMLFGVERLEMNCPECGLEVHTELTFPDGASTIFIDKDPFGSLI